jgi:hypothetical protein
VRQFKWWMLPVVLVGALVWLELFLQRPLEAVILLVAIMGWGDYRRRRAKLKPPDD